MEITTLIYTLLFVPLAILLVIFGCLYMRDGYKRDLGNSLISLAATVVAIPISLLLTKLVAWLISLPVSNALAKITAEESAAGTAMMRGMAKGGVQVALSMVLFVVFFAIALGVLKSLGKKYVRWDKLDALNADIAKTKWAGLGVRFADALVVAVMLLLPLYGTIAMAAPIASSVLNMSVAQVKQDAAPSFARELSLEEGVDAEDLLTDDMVGGPTQEEQILTLVTMMERHPALAPYKYGPAEWVYAGLSKFSMNGKTVDIDRAVEVLNGLLDRVQALIATLEGEDPAPGLQAAEELVDYTRENVIEERWFYNLFMAILGEFDKAMDQYGKGPQVGESYESLGSLAMISDEANRISAAEMELLLQARQLLDMSFADFKSNGIALLDFLSYILEPQNLSLLMSEGEEVSEELLLPFADELMGRFGAVINHSEQAGKMKKFIYTLFMAESDLGDHAAAAFEKNWGNGVLTDPQLQKRDAISFFMMSNRNFYLLQAMAINPLFGADAAVELMDPEMITESVRWTLSDYVDDETINAVFTNYPSLWDELVAKLRTYEQMPIDAGMYINFEGEFEEYVIGTIADKLGVRRQWELDEKIRDAEDLLYHAIKQGIDDTEAFNALASLVGRAEAQQRKEEYLGWFSDDYYEDEDDDEESYPQGTGSLIYTPGDGFFIDENGNKITIHPGTDETGFVYNSLFTDEEGNLIYYDIETGNRYVLQEADEYY